MELLQQHAQDQNLFLQDVSKVTALKRFCFAKNDDIDFVIFCQEKYCGGHEFWDSLYNASSMKLPVSKFTFTNERESCCSSSCLAMTIRNCLVVQLRQCHWIDFLLQCIKKGSTILSLKFCFCDVFIGTKIPDVTSSA